LLRLLGILLRGHMVKKGLQGSCVRPVGGNWPLFMTQVRFERGGNIAKCGMGAVMYICHLSNFPDLTPP